MFDMIFWLAALAYAGYRAVHAATWTSRAIWSALGIFALLMMALNAFGKRFGQTPAAAGAAVDEMERKLYAGPHVRRVVDADEVRRLGLDAAFYEAETREMERLGFRHVADYVDETNATAVPGARAVLRALLSRDGATMAATYDVRFGGWMRLLQLVRLLPNDLRCTEFEVELDDGSFVCTGNAFEASKAADFPNVSRRFLPARTPTADVYAEHGRHVAEVLAARPDASPIVHRDLRDLWAAQDRLELMKSRHRNSRDYDVAASLERVAGRPLRGAEREMADEAARLHADRTRG